MSNIGVAWQKLSSRDKVILRQLYEVKYSKRIDEVMLPFVDMHPLKNLLKRARKAKDGHTWYMPGDRTLVRVGRREAHRILAKLTQGSSHVRPKSRSNYR